jgi:hypothetical protein
MNPNKLTWTLLEEYDTPTRRWEDVERERDEYFRARLGEPLCALLCEMEKINEGSNHKNNVEKRKC